MRELSGCPLVLRSDRPTDGPAQVQLPRVYCSSPMRGFAAVYE